LNNNYTNNNNNNITTIPETFKLVELYSKNNNYFLKNFSNSFVKMVTVGYTVLPKNVLVDKKKATNGKLGFY
jgi:hypothetical protein